jgi:hypothetical protein
MKQRPTYLIAGIALISLFVYRSNNTSLETLPDGSTIAIIINKDTKTDLNNFLSLYQSGRFESIKLIDAKTLV